MLSQRGQRASQSEAEIDGQHAGIGVVRQVREGLEGLLEGGHRLADRAARPGSGTGLLAVGDGFVPHLAPQGMVRQAFDLLGAAGPAASVSKRLDDAGVQRPPPLLRADSRRPPRGSGHA